MRGLVAHMRPTRNSPWTRPCVAAGTGCARALLAHPLVGQHDLADRLADTLVAENAAYLPWAGPR